MQELLSLDGVMQGPGDATEFPGGGCQRQFVESRKLVRYLHQHDLVDEYRLWILPIVVGSGTRLFDEGLDTSRWQLKDVERTEEDVVVLRYRRPLK